MHIRHLLLPLLLLAALPAAAQPGTPPQQGEEVLDRVVAVVGDTVLLMSDVRVEIERLQAQGQQIPTDPVERGRLVQEIVNQRVDELVLLQAARAAGIPIESSDVDPLVDQQIQQVQQRFGSEQALRDALARSGRSLEEYRQSLVLETTAATLLQRYAQRELEKRALPHVSDEELRAFFEANRTRFGTRPANVSFQQAVIQPHPSDSAKATARRRAEEVLAELRAGGDFEVLARRYSDDPSKERGGDLGWFREGQMVRPFEQAVYAMRPGQVSPVVETEYGYHIIRLEKIRGPERQARHILIRPVLTDADVARARASADSVARAAQGGAALPELAERYGTPADQRVSRHVPLTQLPPAYAAALQTAVANQVVGPFEVTGGPNGTAFVVARLTDRQAEGPVELADVEERIRERLQQEKVMAELVAELRRVTHVRILL
ncbi:MAG TPA: peptidylprolyl isomerase [Longimicrobiaceae bacterium]|nr:peptidylprolyl isomerase [Longimicrobiaceae bacterium]